MQEYTHNTNHIIDVLMTQLIGLIKVIKCKTGIFISDHQLAYMDISIRKPQKKAKTIEIRYTTSITADVFLRHFDPSKILEAQSLSNAIELFNNLVGHALNHVAPMREIIMTRNLTQPWYDNDIRAQH